MAVSHLLLHLNCTPVRRNKNIAKIDPRYIQDKYKIPSGRRPDPAQARPKPGPSPAQARSKPGQARGRAVPGRPVRGPGLAISDRKARTTSCKGT